MSKVRHVKETKVGGSGSCLSENRHGAGLLKRLRGRDKSEVGGSTPPRPTFVGRCTALSYALGGASFFLLTTGWCPLWCSLLLTHPPPDARRASATRLALSLRLAADSTSRSCCDPATRRVTEGQPSACVSDRWRTCADGDATRDLLHAYSAPGGAILANARVDIRNPGARFRRAACMWTRPGTCPTLAAGMTDPLQQQLRDALGVAYTITRELSGGGMSRVFVAEETALGRRVVVKVLPPEMAAAGRIERFKREIVLAARLQHPHIVPLLTAGESDGLPYFTMPFVDGRVAPRATRAARRAAPATTPIRVLREVASGARVRARARDRASRHQAGQRAAVRRRGDGDGLRRREGASALESNAGTQRKRNTSLGVALGTPAYMAPEQASGRSGDRSPRGHLRVRRAGVRGAHRPAAIRRTLAAGRCSRRTSPRRPSRSEATAEPSARTRARS